MVETLERLDLSGPAAFERDCLSFMLDGWPSYPEAGASDECFTIADVNGQVDDLRAAAEGDQETLAVLDGIRRLLDATAPTLQ